MRIDWPPETVEHFLVECTRYEEERGKLITSIKTVIGEQEWLRRIEEEEDGGVLTVLGLYQGERERERERERRLFVCV